MTDQRREADVDDAFRAILEGLRTTLPGVQVLFAFLLVLPLQQAFAGLETLERGTYYVAFFGSAIASVLLIAPSAHQRIRAPMTGVKRRSERDLRITVYVTITGTVVFAVALTAAVFLVSKLVLTTTPAVLVTLAVAGTVIWAWFYLPLVTFQQSHR